MSTSSMEANSIELVPLEAKQRNEASTEESLSGKLGDGAAGGRGSLVQRLKAGLLKTRTSQSASEGNENTLKKEINLFSAVGYVVGGIIGSGIFITPKTILCLTGSFGLSLVVWVIGGVIAAAGGLCYVELGLLIRKSGGEYSYLKEAYSFRNKYKVFEVLGSLLSFVFVWGSMLIIRPSSVAIIALTCARYLVRPFYIDCETVPIAPVKLLTLSIIRK